MYGNARQSNKINNNSKPTPTVKCKVSKSALATFTDGGWIDEQMDRGMDGRMNGWAELRRRKEKLKNEKRKGEKNKYRKGTGHSGDGAWLLDV